VATGDLVGELTRGVKTNIPSMLLTQRAFMVCSPQRRPLSRKNRDAGALIEP